MQSIVVFLAQHFTAFFFLFFFLKLAGGIAGSAGIGS
jgi:hypothetical protein